MGYEDLRAATENPTRMPVHPVTAHLMEADGSEILRIMF
jgi:hypothetical protein